MRKVIFALLLLPMLIVSCSGPQEPVFVGMQDVEVVSFTMQNATVKGSAKYYNPNPFGVKIKSSNFDVKANDIEIGNVTQEHGIDVSGEEEFMVPLIVSFPPSKVLADGDNLLTSVFKALGNKKIQMQYKGTLTIDVAGVDMDIPFEYEEEINLKKK